MIYDELYRLKYIIRYSNYMRITNEDVAQHSYFVSCLCIKLYEEYPQADLGHMLLMATIHDWAEVEIDDIAHNVKREYPAVGKALKSAELKVMRKQFPGHIVDSYTEYEKQETLESQIVKLADIMQCIQYLGAEMDLGNKTIGTLYEESSISAHKQRIKIQETILNANIDTIRS